jgi:hypothetical protein
MRIEETTLYLFDELSDEAQERAIEDARNREINTFDSFWYEDVIGYWFVEEVAAKKGFDVTTNPVKLMNGSYRHEPNVHFSGFWNQGDGASFEANVDVEKFILAHKWGNKFRRVLNLARGAHDGSVCASIGRTNPLNYYYARTMSVEVEWDANVEYGEDDWERINAQVEDFRDCLEDVARDLAGELYNTLEREYEYLNSDEAIADTLRANEYEFTVDGEIF